MINIRFHGRGGQGMKTASRILGSAFFLSGFEVQDAPKYGAERRGAPITAYVRTSKDRIFERGVIKHPELVVVADDSLIPIFAAGVLTGIHTNSVLLIRSADDQATWKERLNLPCPVLLLPIHDDARGLNDSKYMSAKCAGAAAKLIGVITKNTLEQALAEELSSLGESMLKKNIEKAKNLNGPRMIIALSPCPTGWGFAPNLSSEIGKLAVKTGVWPLKEYVNGEVVHSKVPTQRKPVEEYLKLQGRFAHLFEPKRNDALLEEIQSRVDAYWAAIK